MRRSLSLFIVMLLVLRGLLGDVMAMGVAPVALSVAPLQHHMHMPIALEHGSASAAAAAACPSQEAVSADDCGHASSPTCTACGICHSTLFFPELLAQALSPQLRALYPLGSTRFVSAFTALDIKPPIF
ncbi:MAG: hypothetical protein KA216_08640 [Giesbergeria sp.]|nr:hypothetical protein [Giesbergeria sp.]